jgi:hypothetical protein
MLILDSFGRQVRKRSPIWETMEFVSGEAIRSMYASTFLTGPILYDQFGARVYSPRPIKTGERMAIRIPVKFEGKTV